VIEKFELPYHVATVEPMNNRKCGDIAHSGLLRGRPPVASRGRSAVASRGRPEDAVRRALKLGFPAVNRNYIATGSSHLVWVH
jgi:hypothetical protein